MPARKAWLQEGGGDRKEAQAALRKARDLLIIWAEAEV